MDKVPILYYTIWIILAPLLWPCASESQIFHFSEQATWTEAREHCKVCYKDLVTAGYDNSLALVRGQARARHWIGLREVLCSDPWSCWANGDPIVFQNWYPMKREPVAEITTAVPKTTTAHPNSTDGFTQTTYGGGLETGFTDITADPETGTDGFTQTTYGGGLETGFTDITADPETGTDGFTHTTYEGTTSLRTPAYVREVCVAMLSFGPWVEEDCAKKLPYICYDDRFYGTVSVDRNASVARLRWSQAPGNITSYHVEVRGDISLNDSVPDLTYDLLNMTAGACYALQVFPVKCDRRLNPMNISFYTKPGKPQNLSACNITESSVLLRWAPPAGRLQVYLVVWKGKGQNTSQEWAVIEDLTPGAQYVMGVASASGDVWSEFANITVCTKPSTVELNISDITSGSLTLSWKRSGMAMGYSVIAVEISGGNKEVFNKTVNDTVQVVTATPGAHLRLTVRALAHGGLEGDATTVEGFLAPAPILSLTLNSNASSIHASWPSPVGSYQLFCVSIELYNSSDGPVFHTTNTTSVVLGSLYAAAMYTVSVSTRAGALQSEPVVNHTYTSPVAPSSATISSHNASHVTLKWEAQHAAATTRYLVSYNGSFWGHVGSVSVTDGSNSLTVGGLRPGSLYQFGVRTVSGKLLSAPASVEQYTDGNNKEITLSLMCSAAKPFICDDKGVKVDAFTYLKKHFNTTLAGVYWDLRWKGAVSGDADVSSGCSAPP